MLYNLTILSLLPNTLGAVLPLLPKAYETHAPSGTALGCFSCEFGVLNRFVFLTRYEDAERLTADRLRLLKIDDPYGLEPYIGGIESTAFKPLSFAEPVDPGSYGPFYEFRSYTIAPGGLAETEAAWAKVMPRRNEMSKLLTIMASIEGAPMKMVHIWPYNSIEDRSRARAEASREKIWPPPGGSAQLTSLKSELFVATAFSGLK